jgi:hypothetical protein
MARSTSQMAVCSSMSSVTRSCGSEAVTRCKLSPPLARLLALPKSLKRRKASLASYSPGNLVSPSVE